MGMAIVEIAKEPVMTKAEEDVQKIRKLEASLSQCRKDLKQYVTAEKVMIAAGRITEDAVNKAHDIVRGL